MTTDVQVTASAGDVLVTAIRDGVAEVELLMTPEQAIQLGGQAMMAALKAARERAEEEMAITRALLAETRVLQ